MYKQLVSVSVMFACYFMKFYHPLLPKA